MPGLIGILGFRSVLRLVTVEEDTLLMWGSPNRVCRHYGHNTEYNEESWQVNWVFHRGSR
jgi:hypothetical protein